MHAAWVYHRVGRFPLDQFDDDESQEGKEKAQVHMHGSVTQIPTVIAGQTALN